MENQGKLFYLLLSLCCASAFRQICLVHEEDCGYRCFDPSVSDCVDGHRVCYKGQIPCNTSFIWNKHCYDPTIETCSQTGICPIGKNGCGPFDCYSPDEETCYNTIDRGIVCKKHESICGKKYCYDPTNATCHLVGYYTVLCQHGELTCAGKCYSPDSGKKCLSDGDILCEKWEELCGYKCYDPNTHTCTNDRLICESGTTLPCGDTRCYSTHNETCFTDRPNDLPPIKCPIDHLPCGYDECFNPQTEVCLNYNNRVGKDMACPIGSKTCHYSCYDPLEKKCLEDADPERGISILCNIDEELCGHYQCYKPGPGVTCNATLGLVCENGEKFCDWMCYNAETHKCT